MQVGAEEGVGRGSFSRSPVNARSLFPPLLWPVNGIKQGLESLPVTQENETPGTTNHKAPTGLPKSGSRISFSQSDPFLALLLRLLYKNLSAAPFGEDLLTTTGLALSDSNRCLLRYTLKMLTVP